MLTALKRVIRTGSINLIRNAYVSFSAVYVITITLLVIGGSLISNQLLTATLDTLRNNVDVNVYFVTTASEESILEVSRTLETLPNVKEVTYLSREETYARFTERHKNNELTIQALEEIGENPLRASLSITAKDPSQYESIAAYLEETTNLALEGGESIIDHINYKQNRNAIDRLTTIINTTDNLSLIIAIVLISVTTLITFNTIRLTIYTARDEISVMRLVGASNSFIRGPFVIQGAFYGLIAGILTLLILYPVTYSLADATETFFGINIFGYFLSNFGDIFLVIVGAGVLMGMVSSVLAVSRYLRV